MPRKSEKSNHQSVAKGDARPVGRSTRRQKKRGRNLLVGLGALIAIVLLVVISSDSGTQIDGTPVEVDSVRIATITETVVAPGEIRPEQEVDIAPEISGEIVALPIEEGSRVSKGTVLVRINPAAMLAEREEVSAQIRSAKSVERGATASLDRLRTELARLERLVEGELASEQDLLAAQTQVTVAEAELDGAKARTSQANAALRRVNESIQKTTIVSPIDGVVTRLDVKLGERVVGSVQMQGTRMMTIANLSVLEAHVDVVETDVVAIKAGDVARVELDAFRNESFRALVTHVGNSPLEAALASTSDIAEYRVRLRILDPDARIRPGMTATATVTTATRENVATVPIQAVTIREKIDRTTGIEGVVDERIAAVNNRPDPMVFVIENGIAIPRFVKTGIRNDRVVEIISGISAGTPLVVGPYRTVSRDLDSGDAVVDESWSATDAEDE